MIDSIVKIVRGIVKLRGGTDGTVIGNTVDNLKVTNVPQDGSFIDAMNRQRVSDQSVVGNFCFNASQHALHFKQSLSGAGTIAYNSSGSSMQLNTTTTNGDSAVLQTKSFFKYNAGLSHCAEISARIGAAKTNVRQRIGFFNQNNGLFFEQTTTALSVVVRSNLSGSIVDTAVVQSSWNLDKLDGTGASGVTIDTSKHNLFLIDFTWFGAGRVRFGILIKGKILYCHEYYGANLFTVPFMRSAHLPIRGEMTNTGTVASSTTMDIACMSYLQESSSPLRQEYKFSQSSPLASLTVGATLLPLIAIRPAVTFNSMTNRVPVEPMRYTGMAKDQHTLFQVILNPTLTGASWNAASGTNSCVEFDIAATAISGGTKLDEFYAAAGTVTEFLVQNVLTQLALDIPGTTADILCLAAQSTAGNTKTWGAIQWREFQ